METLNEKIIISISYDEARSIISEFGWMDKEKIQEKPTLNMLRQEILHELRRKDF